MATTANPRLVVAEISREITRRPAAHGASPRPSPRRDRQLASFVCVAEQEGVQRGEGNRAAVQVVARSPICLRACATIDASSAHSGTHRQECLMLELTPSGARIAEADDDDERRRIARPRRRAAAGASSSACGPASCCPSSRTATARPRRLRDGLLGHGLGPAVEGPADRMPIPTTLELGHACAGRRRNWNPRHGRPRRRPRRHAHGPPPAGWWDPRPRGDPAAPRL